MISLYSKFLSLLIKTSLIPGYTRHKGRVGSAPSWETNLPVGTPAPKDLDSLGFSSKCGLPGLDPWPSLTRSLPLGLGSPLAYITNTTLSPSEFGIRREIQNIRWRIISKFGNLSYYINLTENVSRKCGSCRDGRSPRVESTATMT